MDKIARDDFVYALEQTMEFYGKELNKMQVTFWVDACRDKPVEKLKKAFREHIRCGRYSPRPAEILAIVDNMAQTRGYTELPPPPETNCPPDIASAWMWFIGRISTGTAMEGLFEESGKVDVATQERYLHIVNHEANKYGTPEAIPDEYKLQEVWS